MASFRLAMAVLDYLLIGILARAADAPSPDKDASLQGTWKLESGEYNSSPLPAELIKHWQTVITVKGNVWTTESTNKDGKRESDDSAIKLDIKAMPKQLDLTETKPDPGKEPEIELAIYKIEGDILTICIARGNDKERPKEFKSGDKRVMVRVYRRVKP